MGLNDKLSVLSALLLTCATLTGVMLVGWRTLGRPRHALVWACAFGAATVQWGANVAYLALWPNRLTLAAVELLGLVVSMLIALGFRERACRPRLPWMWAVAMPLVAAGVGGALLLNLPGVALAIGNLQRAAMLCLAAAALVPARRAARAAERATAVILVLFAATSLLTGALSVVGVIAEGAALLLARRLLLLTLPSALTAVGLTAVLLLASDLAERLQELAARDPLTDALNRRGFREAALRALARATRAKRPACVVLADIDRFKAINDTWGHATGDAVLVRVAGYLEGAIRVGDLFGRLGGEEFAILLEGVGEQAGADVIERIRAGIECLDLGLAEPVRLTVSFGIAATTPGDATGHLDALLDAADRALYASKLGGRNRITCAGFEGPPLPSPADRTVTASAE